MVTTFKRLFFSGFYPKQFQKFKVLISTRAACDLKSWHKEEEKREKGVRKGKEGTEGAKTNLSSFSYLGEVTTF